MITDFAASNDVARPWPSSPTAASWRPASTPATSPCFRSHGHVISPSHAKPCRESRLMARSPSVDSDPEDCEDVVCHVVGQLLRGPPPSALVGPAGNSWPAGRTPLLRLLGTNSLDLGTAKAQFVPCKEHRRATRDHCRDLARTRTAGWNQQDRVEERSTFARETDPPVQARPPYSKEGSIADGRCRAECGARLPEVNGSESRSAGIRRSSGRRRSGSVHAPRPNASAVAPTQ